DRSAPRLERTEATDVRGRGGCTAARRDDDDARPVEARRSEGALEDDRTASERNGPGGGSRPRHEPEHERSRETRADLSAAGAGGEAVLDRGSQGRRIGG